MILIRKNIDNEIVVAIGAISQNRAIKKAEVLQNQIQEVNTADWYLSIFPQKTSSDIVGRG